MTIWCNMRFPGTAERRLVEGTAGHRLVFSSALQASNLVSGVRDPQLLEAEVAFGQPDPEMLMEESRIRWAHLSSAGYERYDRADLREALKKRSVALTNSSLVYMEPCAEHALAMMLAIGRQLPGAVDEQRAAHGWPAAELRAKSRLLKGQCVVLLGYGAIGRRLAEMLGPFETRTIAIRRNVKGDEEVETYPESRVEEFLGIADHVVNLLPGGKGTESFMHARRFSKLKPSAIYYSIGRGGTTDQEALVSVLREKRIAGAYLDVTTPEPLPAEHPLWMMENCYITPHTAGGHDDEHVRLVNHFLENLARFERGEALADRIV